MEIHIKQFLDEHIDYFDYEAYPVEGIAFILARIYKSAIKDSTSLIGKTIVARRHKKFTDYKLPTKGHYVIYAVYNYYIKTQE